MFGTSNLVYTPVGSKLIFDDVYRWTRHEFDVHRFGVRIRASVFEDVAGAVRAALETIGSSNRFTGDRAELAEHVNRILSGLAPRAGGLEEEISGSLKDILSSEDSVWWLRIGDQPAESLFAEDYETPVQSGARTRPHFLFGNVRVEALDGLEVELPGDEDGLPFSLDIPTDGGTNCERMPATEPLALVDEFCGTHGVSSRGRTINIGARAEVSPSHEFCTPIGTIEGGLFATLYIHHRIAATEPVIAPIQRRALGPCLKVLEKNGFKLVNEGRKFRIFDRDGDTIHLYDGLEGHEAGGVDVMPSFILVARSGGEYDPAFRAEMLEATLSTLQG